MLLYIFILPLVDLLRRRRRSRRSGPRGLLLVLLGNHEHGVMGRGRPGGALLRGLSVVRRTRRHGS